MMHYFLEMMKIHINFVGWAGFGLTFKFFSYKKINHSIAGDAIPFFSYESP